MTRTLAVVGTHCVRKTTAVNHLSGAAMAAGRAVVIVPEVARTSPLAINEATTAEAQLWIATTQIARELEAGSAGAQLLLTDGALVNDYAYLLRSADAAATPSDERKAFGAYAAGVDPFGLRDLVFYWTAQDVTFLFLRPDVPAVADGVRSTDEAFRHDIDRRLAILLTKFARPEQIHELAASAVSPDLDWAALLARLAPES